MLRRNAKEIRKKIFCDECLLPYIYIPEVDVHIHTSTLPVVDVHYIYL